MPSRPVKLTQSVLYLLIFLAHKDVAIDEIQTPIMFSESLKRYITCYKKDLALHKPKGWDFSLAKTVTWHQFCKNNGLPH